jgi:tetratricopeptide (TPR) repeat protein
MPEARDHAEQAITFFQRIGDRVQVEGIRAELAGMYLNVREFEKVIEPAEKALQYFERIRHDRWIASISGNLAEAYMETGRLDQAKEMVFRVMRMEIPASQPFVLYTLGHVHDREGNRAHAIASFSQGIQIARANHDPFIEAYLQRALGVLLGQNGDHAMGREHLETALRMFTEMGLEHEYGPTEEAMREIREQT